MNIPCTKTTYKTVRKANAAATNNNHWNKMKHPDRKGLRAYKCYYCGYFHLTSMSKEEYEVDQLEKLQSKKIKPKRKSNKLKITLR